MLTGIFSLKILLELVFKNLDSGNNEKIRNCFSFCFFVFRLVGQEQKETNPNGYTKFYYDNGKIASEGFMHDGKPDGYWKTFYETGKIKSQGNRKDFELDSLWFL